MPETYYLPCKPKTLEAAPGFEPGSKALQASALPLGYAAPLVSFYLPRSTGAIGENC